MSVPRNVGLQGSIRPAAILQKAEEQSPGMYIANRMNLLEQQLQELVDLVEKNCAGVMNASLSPAVDGGVLSVDTESFPPLFASYARRLRDIDELVFVLHDKIERISV